MKLQFTNGYQPRFDQISRILQFLLSREGQKKTPVQEIVSTLGIPERQVKNLTSMMVGFGLVKPRVITLTPFGKSIIQGDTYFEKTETLWMIHYIVSSNPEWIIWHRIVNTVIPTHDRVSVEFTSSHYFSDLTVLFSEKTIAEHLPKEVKAVLTAYTYTEFSRLNILNQEETGNFIRSTPVEVPSFAFLFCLLHYRDQFSVGSSAMNTKDVCLAENSPGRVFNLPEYQVRAILEDLQSASLIRLEQFANLDQVRLPDSLTQESVLQRIYEGINGN